MIVNKSEFLDMLKDYLLKYYSEEETLDILRDYEEYFLNGKLDGKTEQEIILELGSPKKIVENLIDEDGVEKNSIFSNLKDRFYRWYDKRFFEKVQKTGNNLKNGTNDSGKEDRLNFSYIFTNVFLFFLNIFVFFAVLICVGILVGMVLLTLGGVVTAVLLTPVTLNGLSFLSMSYAWIIFPVILAIGLFIIMSVLIYYFFKFLSQFILEYLNWVKTQMMYKKVARENTMDNNTKKVKDENEEVE